MVEDLKEKELSFYNYYFVLMNHYPYWMTVIAAYWYLIIRILAESRKICSLSTLFSLMIATRMDVNKAIKDVIP
ncbi:unnamed protein product [Brugia pahangi]|uniref:Bestrophin homolog n=1 Tax=Brugia pahangi TaxID=6280 RepID=A0A0N4U091_BRUPA|nr:unnamed protein product [Brugia pahangi]